jgi:hypothetical protein
MYRHQLEFYLDLINLQPLFLLLKIQDLRVFEIEPVSGVIVYIASAVRTGSVDFSTTIYR